jgi:Caenorhabditis protein of unknown function, DUF268
MTTTRRRAALDRVRSQTGNRVDTLSRVFKASRESSLKRVARRAARPLLSPIDGRVADINRRVENVRASTESSLDAYALSASESYSYIGVELRRLHDLLAGFGERSFQENYARRLADACHLPLEELDETLAQVINYATGNRGFYAQAGLWFNPPIAVTLSAGGAAPTQVTERIVEVPFAMAALNRVQHGVRILDVGSAESTFPLSAASLGYKVTAIDPRPLPYSHPNLQSHASLLEDWAAPPASFSAAFLISTIEHVGLGAYGEGRYGNSQPGAGADVALLDHVRELLSPDGLLILTAPYGVREVTELERVYDEESFSRLLAGWDVLERQTAVRRDALVWEAAEQVEPGARGVAMLIASPKRQR